MLSELLDFRLGIEGSTLVNPGGWIQFRTQDVGPSPASRDEVSKAGFQEKLLRSCRRQDTRKATNGDTKCHSTIDDFVALRMIFVAIRVSRLRRDNL